MFNRLQLLLDAHTLGVLARNIAAMPNVDAETSRKIWTIRNRIMARYGSHDPLGCELKIRMILKAQENG
jgi:hypothetical protein